MEQQDTIWPDNPDGSETPQSAEADASKSAEADASKSAEADASKSAEADASKSAGADASKSNEQSAQDAEEHKPPDDESIGLFDTFVPNEPPSGAASDELPQWAVDELKMLRKELFALLSQIEAIVGEMPDDDSTGYR